MRPRRPRRLWLVVALGLVAGTALLVAARPRRVEVVPVAREDVTRVLAVTGRVAPLETVRVAPLVAGRIVGLAREEGEPVREGEVLARIDPVDAEATLAQARATLASRRAELAQARRDKARAEVLARQDLIPPAELEARRAAVETGAADVARLRAAVREAEALRSKHELRATLSGWVLDRPVDEGQVVRPHDVVYEIATARTPRVEAEVDERYLGALREGMRARAVPVGAGADGWLPAVVETMPRRVDEATGAGVVKLRLERVPGPLPSGLSMDVNIDVARHEDALTVPRAAVVQAGGRAWVLVVARGRAERRSVEVIDWPADRVVVRAGLRAGERVALDPDAVAPGRRVRARARR